MTPLTVAAAQPPTVSHDVAANARAHAAVIRSAGARVVVFPELSLTGYELDADVVAPHDQRLAPVVDACAEMSTVALAGAVVAGPHIATLVIDGGGASIGYRKMWLGPAEIRRFRPGVEPAVLNVDGWRLGLAICKDTGVVEHAARTAASGIDAYVAGVVHHRSEGVELAHRAHRVATHQQVWVAVASMAGDTGGGYTPAAGSSGIWAPGGRVIDRVDAGVGGVAVGLLGG